MTLTIIQKPSPNFDDRHGIAPSLIILHYTGMKTAREALDRLTDIESKVSAHYTVDMDGTIYQHVDEKNRAWHAGAGAWKSYKDINRRSIGIEIVNKGHQYGYHVFPEEQMCAVKNLCHEIIVRHKIEPEDVLAHSDTAPSRKEDPGELFPWEELAKEGIGIWPDVSVEDSVKSYSIDIFQALFDFGYRCDDPQKSLLAFQRHYVPHVFSDGKAGVVTTETKGRIYALLAEHLIIPHKL